MPLETTDPTDAIQAEGSVLIGLRELLSGIMLSAPILIWQWHQCLGYLSRLGSTHINQLLQLILTSLIIVTCGRSIFSRGIRSLATGNLNMFTLITVGVSAASGFSLIATLLPTSFLIHFRIRKPASSILFDAAAMIIVLVQLGQALENQARSKTGAELRSLVSLAPMTASCTRKW